MNKPRRAAQLLAKSSTLPNGDPITVASHTKDVMDAAAALFGGKGTPSVLAAEWCHFFGLAPGAIDAFLINLRVAAFCHDWGKANDGFQAVLAHTGNQLLRHEQISAIVICWSTVWKWLSDGSSDVELVLSTVLGHHLKCRDVDLGKPESEADQCLRVRWDDKAFRAFLTSTAQSVGLSADVPDDFPLLSSFGGEHGGRNLDVLLDAVRDRLEVFDDEIRKDTPAAADRRRMLWAVRAALIAADSAGSGLVRMNRPIIEWVQDCVAFHGEAASADGRMTGDTIRRLVIEPRMISSELREEDLNPFQLACNDRNRVPERALLLAPCGSGKTLAAWRWIAARLDEKPRGRAIFLYPTRGTATEGYRGYAGLAGDEVAALMHGTADLDLDDILMDASPERRISEARLFALRQWPKRVFSATVDQFLGFMQHGYGATCQLPLLVDSVIVLDEVHSYDRGMWSALIEFLQTFPTIPVLCMTATLLPRRIDDLRKINLKIVNGLDLDGGDESELTRAANYPRYRVRRVSNQAEAKAAAETALKRGERVLWVVNTVDRCQAIATEFAENPGAAVLRTHGGHALFCYHSRYKLNDRKASHNAVVSAFKPGCASGGVLAVTTQVCEMSLDLDADLLITELCPATALVQRMGRCCRDPEAHKNCRTGDVILYAPEEILPYTKADLSGVDRVVDKMLLAAATSQEQLAAFLDEISPPVELPKACRFTQSGVWAAAGEEQFRDVDDLARPALHADDLEEYARLKDPKKRGHDAPWKADALVMNLPKKFTQEHGRHDLPPWLKMAQGGTYRTALGYCGGDLPSHKLC